MHEDFDPLSPAYLADPFAVTAQSIGCSRHPASRVSPPARPLPDQATKHRPCLMEVLYLGQDTMFT